MKAILILLVASLVCPGCVYIRYEGGGTKTTYFAPAFGHKSIGNADLKNGTIGDVNTQQSQMGAVIKDAGTAALPYFAAPVPFLTR